MSKRKGQKRPRFNLSRAAIANAHKLRESEILWSPPANQRRHKAIEEVIHNLYGYINNPNLLPNLAMTQDRPKKGGVIQLRKHQQYRAARISTVAGLAYLLWQMDLTTLLVNVRRDEGVSVVLGKRLRDNKTGERKGMATALGIGDRRMDRVIRSLDRAGILSSGRRFEKLEGLDEKDKPQYKGLPSTRAISRDLLIALGLTPEFVKEIRDHASGEASDKLAATLPRNKRLKDAATLRMMMGAQTKTILRHAANAGSSFAPHLPTLNNSLKAA